ncbi:L,D-transpeptidase family protein [Labrys neptuniae]|uniref:L,D-transpeptidase family protein n=1 Tax=Labrys neptuniae TaxID=376174 RepID=UPI002890A7A0|nr:L,D-transpeptidase family protein [Labrys neptuniae]MDT3377941.1 L,D-transpeptidase family protein [Labrys neptuniae]
MKQPTPLVLAAVSVLALVLASPALAQDSTPPTADIPVAAPAAPEAPAAPAAPAAAAEAPQPASPAPAPAAQAAPEPAAPAPAATVSAPDASAPAASVAPTAPAAADNAAPAAPAATPAKPKVAKKPVPAGPSYAASTPIKIPATPWSSMPTFDAGSLDRLNGLSQYYAQIARNGGFPAAPPTGLSQGATGSAVLALRQRLVMEKDLPESERDNPKWDARLTTAVSRFQQRYGLQATGKIDERTRAQMAVSVQHRLVQIGHNMERVGARFIDFNRRYVVVNIPSAQVEAIENGEVARRYIAVVGRPQNPSPEVDATISAINFNPTWTVPQSIIKKEIGPHMVRDPSYLSRQRMSVIDGSGRTIDPKTIDWSSGKAANYTIRQAYGAGNSLGQLRIQMPNSDSVYMHDTPSKRLFGSVDRFFSHGCVRVQGVNDLAAWLLGSGWDAKRVGQEIATGARKDQAIPDRVPVHWVYMTAYVTPDGTAHFRPDIYNLDFGSASRIADAQVVNPY